MDNIEWLDTLPPAKRGRGAMCGVYVIEHVKSGNWYVGSTNDLVRRKRENLNSLSAGTSHNPTLQKLYNDSPELRWRFYITKDREQAFAVEQQIIDSAITLVNIAKDACNPGIGHINPEGWAKMISERNKGNRYAAGREVTAEQRERLSKLHKGKTISEEHRAAVSAKLKGVAQSAELIEARRMALRASDKIKRKHPTINGVTYQSVVDAAHALNISKSTVKFRIKSKTEEWKDWYYLAEGNEENASSGDVS